MYLGCTSVVVPDGEHLDFEVVRETMAHSAVTVAHFVPSVPVSYTHLTLPTICSV